MLARMRQARAHHLRASANKAPLQARRFIRRSTLPAACLPSRLLRTTPHPRFTCHTDLQPATCRPQQHKTHVV